MRHFFYLLIQSVVLALTFIGLAKLAEAAGLLSLLGVQDWRSVVYAAMGLGWVGAFSSWLLSKSVAVWSIGTRDFAADDARKSAGDVPTTVARLAAKLRIVAPELAVYPSPQVTAFAVGWRRSRSLLVVSDGLLDRLAPPEAEAVLAQEMARIALGDVSTLLLMHGLLNVFTIFPARMLAFTFGTSLRSFEEDTPSDGVEVGIMVALEVVLTSLATLVTRQYSRAAELRADRLAATVVGRERLDRALELLEREDGRFVPREVFVWPLKFGTRVPRRARLVGYHVAPGTRRARLSALPA